MCVHVCICTCMRACMCSDELALLRAPTYIRLLIGLTGVCVVWYEHLFLRLRAPIGVCGVCVREGRCMLWYAID